MKKRIFGHMPDGTPIEEYTLKSDTLGATVITYGAILRTLEVGGLDIIGGYDTSRDRFASRVDAPSKNTAHSALSRSCCPTEFTTALPRFPRGSTLTP